MEEQSVTVERSITVDASPDDVWEHVIDGTVGSDWMGSPLTIDPRPGGRVDFVPDDTPYIGTVEEIEPGHSITWSWRHPDRDPSQVTITIEATEDGTIVTVTETLLPYTITDTREWPPLGEQRASGVLLAA